MLKVLVRYITIIEEDQWLLRQMLDWTSYQYIPCTSVLPRIFSNSWILTPLSLNNILSTQCFIFILIIKGFERIRVNSPSRKNIKGLSYANLHLFLKILPSRTSWSSSLYVWRFEHWGWIGVSHLFWIVQTPSLPMSRRSHNLPQM